MAKKYIADDWDERFKSWKAEKEKRIAEAKKIQEKKESKLIEKKPKYIIKGIKKNIEKAEKETWDYIAEPKHIKIIKFLVILVPIIILGFIFYQNFLATHNFNYFYDIGSENDEKDNYLSPAERISEIIIDSDNLNHRNLTSQLVYFDAPITKSSDIINISIKFKDDFPENSNFLLGAKDQEEWHYTSKTIYNPTIEKLMQKYVYERQDDLILFKLNKNAQDYTIEQLLTNPPLIKLATDQNITIPDFKIENYQPNNFEIDIALRGNLIFYVYIKGDFEVKVEKRDLNWYDEDEKGEDELYINLYDLNNSLIASETIEDDGIDEKKPDKNNTDEQRETLFVSNLDEGVYKLELKNNADMVITNIELNQNKIVLYKNYFPVQSNAYFNDLEKKSRVYFKTPKPINLTVQTWHDVATNQTIKINGEKDYELEIEERAKEYSLELPISDYFYELTSRKNDINVKGPEFFSFSEDSWFNPFISKKIDFKNNLEYLENNADYVLVEYKPVKNLENGWKVAETSFNLNELYTQDGKLNLMFNVPHLNTNQNETNQMYIPIDWINITVHKPGLIEKYREKKQK